jgi:hypothetical protein
MGSAKEQMFYLWIGQKSSEKWDWISTRCISVLCSTVQYGINQYCTLLYCTVLYGTEQHCVGLARDGNSTHESKKSEDSNESSDFCDSFVLSDSYDLVRRTDALDRVSFRTGLTSPVWYCTGMETSRTAVHRGVARPFCAPVQ